MDQVVEFFSKLLDTADWPPRWHCGKWSDFHGWLYIISDLMIWSAYFAIPLIILNFIRRRKDVRFYKIYFLFAGFILACGSTHFLDAVIFWFPAYRLSALVRAITGIVSWMTVFHLIRILPTAFSLKTSEELEKEIEQRKKAEAALKVKNDMLNEAQEIARIGYWQWDIASNEVEWSHSLFQIYGLKITPNYKVTYEQFLQSVHPDDRGYVDNNIKEALAKKKFSEYYHRVLLPDGTVKTLHAKGEVLLNDQHEVEKMIGTGQDVTEMKQAERELLLKTQELEASNLELQQFAYIASHDLQEPLRKIITFTGILEKTYLGAMDEKAKEYMGKVINSSSRMQKLIDDILYISKFNTEDNLNTSVHLDVILEEVLNDLELTIESSGATIKVSKLPEMEGNPTQIRQLFQNLLTNAIKFRKAEVKPVIEVNGSVKKGASVSQLFSSANQRNFRHITNPRFWDNEKFLEIKVKDNGIGFDPAYAEKIFVIFQRLHGKSAYEGTGIGLSICKKIVDKHHGIIFATGVQGEGSEFTIILPLSQHHFTSTAGGTSSPT